MGMSPVFLRRPPQSVRLISLAILPALSWAITVNVQTPATSSVGAVTTWNAALGEAPEATMWYRFRVRGPGETQFRLVYDYGPRNSWNWTPIGSEGTYEIEVTARSIDSGESESTVVSYEVESRVTGDTPVITPTSNALVFLYSAPPCPAGSRVQISFTAPDGYRQFTPSKDCVEGKSINVYLAGMRAETDYTVQQIISASDASSILGPPLMLRTGTLPFAPTGTMPRRKPAGSSDQSILFQNRVFELSVATDGDGNVVWYYPEIAVYLTRPQPGGYFFFLLEGPDEDDSGQILRQVDLAGNTVFETNAARINEQLDALGKSRITSFHHEARRLPDGRILVLAANERLLRDVQGPGEVDVIGDMILVLNSDLEVEWAWDAFDHLDVTRKAILDQKCLLPGTGGCPVFRLAGIANDWLHGNSLALTPDGNIIYSARHQDWIIKIDYRNGSGTGAVLWRLGQDGDFRIESGDPAPWFSHQHDASFVESESLPRLLVFDNGNTRYATDASARSRGQIFEIDESTLTARLVFNVDLGGYAVALGSAQRLSNGNYHFNLGWTPDTHSHSLEYTPAGELVTHIEAGTQQYRSLRMRDLYTPE
jgi:arylsulfate sulfotransferase